MQHMNRRYLQVSTALKKAGIERTEGKNHCGQSKKNSLKMRHLSRGPSNEEPVPWSCRSRELLPRSS